MNATTPKIVTAEAVPAADEKRIVRKLTIEIVDQDALLAAYPAVELVITKKTIDRKKLRPIVNALHRIGAPVPGVKAYYAADGVDPEAAESDTNA